MSDRGPADVVILSNTGFVGTRLSEYLSEQHVRVAGFGSRELDLRRSDALHRLDGLLGPDTLVVVTAITGAGSAMTAQALAESVQMIANLATYLESNPPRRCIYFSSDAVYAMSDALLTEDAAYHLESFYAVAKFAGERLLQQVLGRAGTSVLVLRPTAIFGPGDTHNAYGPNRFVRALARGETIQLFGAGEETRDHLFIDDLARIVAELNAANVEGVLNVATGITRSFASILTALAELSGEMPKVESLPRRGPITHRKFDISRLRAALPHLAFTAFEDALRMSLRAAAVDVPT